MDLSFAFAKLPILEAVRPWVSPFPGVESDKEIVLWTFPANSPEGRLGFRIGSSIYGFVRWEKVSQTAQPSNIQYIIICET